MSQTTQKAKSLLFAALCAATIVRAQIHTPVLDDWTQFETLVEDARELQSFCAGPLYPPANLRFTIDCGTFGFDEDGFGILTNAAPQTAFGTDVWSVRVSETNGWLYYTSGDVFIQLVPAPFYDPQAWVREFYGEMPEGLAGTVFEESWYAQRARERFEYVFTLIPFDELETYHTKRREFELLKSMFAAKGGDRSPNEPESLSFTEIEIEYEGTNATVRLSAVWPPTYNLPEDVLVLLHSETLESRTHTNWSILHFVDVNVIDDYGYFTTNVVQSTATCFYQLVTCESLWDFPDTNDTGIPDIIRRYIGLPIGVEDSDGDGLPDGYEIFV
ncbi:MAG: hypothetical protein FWG05_01770, partial [Kiritimatiellaeota bacterium]|nr:hypothetical protein [Kiritimatiellota bacterium]